MYGAEGGLPLVDGAEVEQRGLETERRREPRHGANLENIERSNTEQRSTDAINYIFARQSRDKIKADTKRSGAAKLRHRATLLK